MRKLQALMLGLALTAPLALGACGAPALTATSQQASAVESQSVPPASAFKTIQAKVTKILPMDTHGLPHQNFVVTVISGNTGKPGDSLQVNNDTKYGSEVEGLKVGDELTIKGTTYPGGIHWTHRANKPGDAGYIKTADGTIYE
jgi:hypothetical protein